MPHSSGGGSSSHGSHHGSSNNHISRTYFRGARRYARYKKDGSIEYAYSDRNIGLMGKGVNFFGLIIAALFIYGVFTLIVDEFKPKEKFDTSSYDSVIWISDETYSLSNVNSLGKRLDEFQDQTGISICVKTMYDSEWKEESSSLEDYAYDDYLRQFDDEYHWYLIYSKNDQKGKDKWSWEGMQGDNTDPILTSAFADVFTDTVQDSLEDGDAFDIAVIKGLDKISPNIMTKPDGSLIFGAVILIGVIGYLAYAFCINERTGNKTRYIKVPGEYSDTPKFIRCYSCGREYIEGTVPVCPYCYNATRYKIDPFYRKKVNEQLESFPR